jgi:chemotaxis protein MotB
MRRKKNEHTDYWLSYADLMSGMLMVFVLLFSFVMLSLKHTEAKIKPTPTPTPKQESVVNRNSITNELIEALKKKNIKVSVVGGDIEMPSDVFFDTNKSELKKAGKDFLNRFAQTYFEVISKKNNLKQVQEIVIEGHTDPDGTDLKNMKLSQDRSYAVYNYLFTEYVSKAKSVDQTALFAAQKKLSTIGHGENKLLPGVTDKQKLRRISFRFRLKDEVVLK